MLNDEQRKKLIDLQMQVHTIEAEEKRQRRHLYKHINMAPTMMKGMDKVRNLLKRGRYSDLNKLTLKRRQLQGEIHRLVNPHG